MTHRHERHRPIMAGIALRRNRAADRKGTIGAIARKSNGDLVLVTATHVVANRRFTDTPQPPSLSQQSSPTSIISRSS